MRNSEEWIYFIEKLELVPDTKDLDFISELNLASVATRYPEDLAKISKDFSQVKTQNILNNTKEIILWLKNELKK